MADAQSARVSAKKYDLSSHSSRSSHVAYKYHCGHACSGKRQDRHEPQSCPKKDRRRC